MQVQLLAHTPNPTELIIAAARQCYSPGFIGDTFGNKPMTDKDADFLRGVIKRGHHSVLEHASFTFGISGISRACSHQLVRFRHASFSQQSQRYVKLSWEFAFDFITPPSILEIPMLEAEYGELMNHCKRFYSDAILMGVPAEDARFALPNATETNIVMTMNVRELYHAFALRCCHRAQWEIRELFNRILTLCQEATPILFDAAGPTCIQTGSCPEGKNSCGLITNIDYTKEH
jgi:thymidylate synthase (FAD)